MGSNNSIIMQVEFLDKNGSLAQCVLWDDMKKLLGHPVQLKRKKWNFMLCQTVIHCFVLKRPVSHIDLWPKSYIFGSCTWTCLRPRKSKKISIIVK